MDYAHPLHRHYAISIQRPASLVRKRNQQSILIAMLIPFLIGQAACLLAFALPVVLAFLISCREFPIQSNKKRAGCIDGLRGYLALFVFVGHSLYWLGSVINDGVWAGVSISPYRQLGAVAVPVFFMITGFLFYPRVMAGLTGSNWLAIYVSRVFRIVPLVIASVGAISLVIAYRFGVPSDYTLKEYFVPAMKWIMSRSEPPLFRHPDSGRMNAYVFWSLTYEWIFYIFGLPTLAAIMTIKPSRVPSFTIPLAVLVCSLAARMFVGGDWLRYVPLFAIGMCVREVNRYPRLREAFTSSIVSFFAASSLAVSAISTDDSLSVTKLCLNGFFFAAVANGNSLWGLLRSKASLVLGECSFRIYVLHGIVLSAIFGSEPARTLSVSYLAAMIPVAGLAITLISAATYLLVERPCIVAGARIAKRVSHHRIMLTPAQLEVAP